jgi:acyl-CoA dehydrogenase
MLGDYRPAWMTDDLAQFADTVRRFAKEHVEPNDLKWRAQHHADREAWLKAGELGLILPDIPEQYGGSGGTGAHWAIVSRELGYAGSSGLGLAINHIVGHYIQSFGTEVQKTKWLPKIASGEVITSVAMTEPGTGSDLQSVRTRADKRDGKYVINGAKTFITNGLMCDMVVVVAKTDPTQAAKGISLIIVDTKTPGFRRGNLLEKIGRTGSDTVELFFDDCQVALDSLLGEREGLGFYQLMKQLPYERAMIAIGAAAAMERAYDLTVEYVRERKVFGKPIVDFQNTRFTLADVKATVLASRLFADYVIQKWIDGTLDTATASMAKFWLTDRQCEVIDRCLQFFGGFGYMMEYPIARMYADARVQRIYGGSNEIQKELVGREL